MNGNPEFRRNLWIQFSSTRVLVGSLLTGLPLLCAVALDMVLRATYESARSTVTQLPPLEFNITTYASRWLAISIVILWAGYVAAGAVVREIRGRTWDAQRLSTLRPWTMAWGKLFGATSLAWTMALITALTYAIAAAFERPLIGIAITLGGILGYGIVCQATGLLASLARLSGRPGDRGGGTMGAFIVGLLATALLGAFAAWALDDRGWFGIRMSEHAVRLITIWFFALWAIVGVYRRMRRELQMRTAPWVWLLFLVSLAVYAEGLAYGRGQAGAALLLPSAVLMLMLWTITLIEAKDPLTLRQCLGWFRRGQWRMAATLVPLWLVTYVIFAMTVIVSIVTAMGDAGMRVVQIPFVGSADALLILVAALLYLTRDVLLVQTLTLGREGHMAGVAGAGILFVLYIAVPAVFIAGKQMDLLGLVLPTGQGGWMTCLLPVAAEVIACIVLFAWRWRVYWRVNAAKVQAA